MVTVIDTVVAVTGKFSCIFQILTNALDFGVGWEEMTMTRCIGEKKDLLRLSLL